MKTYILHCYVGQIRGKCYIEAKSKKKALKKFKRQYSYYNFLKIKKIKKDRSSFKDGEARD